MTSMDTIAKAGERRVTLKDIAKRLDVSHATVSRALNRPEDPLISEATKLRVLHAATEMGYRPNQAARTLATGRTGLVALWLWSEAVPNSYHAYVSQLMHAEAHRRSCQLIVDLVCWATLEARKDNLFEAWHVDGIVAHESGPAFQTQFLGSHRPPVPVVSTGAYHFLPGVDRVSIDVFEGAVLAMNHLIEQGRRRIMYVTDDLAHRGADPWYIAYTSQLKDFGLESIFLDVQSTRAAVRVAVREYVRVHGAPDALFCHNDDMAIAAYRGLCDLGVRVPDDVAIVGCDGIEDTEYLEVPLTTIAQPLVEMCRVASQFLEQRIEDPSRPIQEVTLPATLVIRSSSGGASQ